MNGLILLVICIFLSTGASVFLKLGTTSGQLDMLFLLQNPMIWIGGLCYSAAFLGYIYVLRLVPLSLAQPVITAGVSILTTLIAAMFLHEQMFLVNWVGLFLMCLGIFFLFSGRMG